MSKKFAIYVFLLLGFLGLLEILGVIQLIPAQCLGYSSNFFGLLPPVCVGYGLNLNPVLGVSFIAIGAIIEIRFGKRRH